MLSAPAEPVFSVLLTAPAGPCMGQHDYRGLISESFAQTYKRAWNKL